MICSSSARSTSTDSLSLGVLYNSIILYYSLVCHYCLLILDLLGAVVREKKKNTDSTDMQNSSTYIASRSLENFVW